jgi:hypothetical protein
MPNRRDIARVDSLQVAASGTAAIPGQDSAWEVAYPSTGPPPGLDSGVDGRILLGLCGGCFRRLQEQNSPPAALALRCGREAKIGTATGPAAPQ